MLMFSKSEFLYTSLIDEISNLQLAHMQYKMNLKGDRNLLTYCNLKLKAAYLEPTTHAHYQKEEL